VRDPAPEEGIRLAVDLVEAAIRAAATVASRIGAASGMRVRVLMKSRIARE